MTLPAAYVWPPVEEFKTTPLPYLERMYEDVAGEIRKPNWRLEGEVTVLAGQTSAAVVVDIDRTPFYIQLTPTWDTTVWPSAETLAGFTVNVGTAPGGDSLVRYAIVVPEAGP